MKYIFASVLLLFSFPSNSQIAGWAWAKNVAGENTEHLNCTATDASGNIYIAGTSSSDSINFDTSALVLSPLGTHLFIAKYGPSGEFLWAKTATSSEYENAISLATDASGNVYLAGSYLGDHIGFDGFYLNSASANTYDIFLTKYDPSGNVLWAKGAGGTFLDEPVALSIDASGNVFMTGYFKSESIFFGSTLLLNDNGGLSSDIFTVKYSTDGNVLWAKGEGASDSEYPTAIDVDPDGNIIVGGYFDSPALAIGTTTLVNANDATKDLILVKYDNYGNVLWAKSAGDHADEIINSITVDNSGKIFVVGYYNSDSVIMGSDTLILTADWDGFFVKYNVNGNVVWAQSISGYGSSGGNEYVSSVIHDDPGNIYIAGYGNYIDSITLDTITLVNYNSSSNLMFIAKYKSDGSVAWADLAGETSGVVQPESIVLDASGNIVLTGEFTYTLAFDTTLFTSPNLGVTDLFLAKLGSMSCTANFYLSADSLIPHHYWAVNLAGGVQPLSFEWSWGDGSFDTIAFPSHTYSTAGFYTICLTITDSSGCVSNHCNVYDIQKMSEAEAENMIVVVDVVAEIPDIPTNIENSGVLQSWQIFPNPASGDPVIQYEISTPAHIRIQIFDVLGHLLQFSETDQKEAGVHILKVDTEILSNGVYIVLINAGNEVYSKRLGVMK